MTKSRAERRVLILFYLLTFYVLLQFAWWAYLLISLNSAYYADLGENAVSGKVWMIVGEGTVFLLILLAVIYIMQATIRKELSRVKQQRNFLLSITHEFKTPLSAIQLGLQTLVKRADLAKDQQEHIVSHAMGNTGRLSALIDNVMLAARIENGQERMFLEKFNVFDRVSDVAYRLAIPDQKASTPLVLAIDRNLEVLADKHAFDSIVGNLIDNALKYGAHAEVQVEAHQIENHFILRISDRGPGIPVAIRSKIFDRFYRGQNEETRSQKGTGLGLYIVNELVNLHQGKVMIEERSGGGTIFEVSFPSQP